MAESFLVARPHLLGVFSFTTGFVASPPQPPKSEEEILLHALFLEKKGCAEEALAFLERHCPKR
ncbi:MAG: hypothetical protein ABA06_02000 [Parcubacteria bacterium C7867-001]|nr:MAG: hypothetical protein ABA06_02000 [Parcubacteria bacterium C7867-001]